MKLEATREKLAAARLQLGKGREDEHKTTGQAFIVFQSEDDRNKLISRFDPDYALVRPGPAARLAARLEARLAESGLIQKKEEAEDDDDGPIKRAKTRGARAPTPAAGGKARAGLKYLSRFVPAPQQPVSRERVC
jgi:hypothetical protein